MNLAQAIGPDVHERLALVSRLAFAPQPSAPVVARMVAQTRAIAARRRPRATKLMSGHRGLILRSLLLGGPQTAYRLSRACAITPAAARMALIAPLRAGIVAIAGLAAAGRKRARVYTLTARGRAAVRSA